MLRRAAEGYRNVKRMWFCSCVGISSRWTGGVVLSGSMGQREGLGLRCRPSGWRWGARSESAYFLPVPEHANWATVSLPRAGASEPKLEPRVGKSIADSLQESGKSCKFTSGRSAGAGELRGTASRSSFPSQRNRRAISSSTTRRRRAVTFHVRWPTKASLGFPASLFCSVRGQ